jgi:AcrR family transcriptional regulator
MADIGKATIYHHFPDKQAIILALLNQDMSHMEDALAATRAETDLRRRFRIAAELSIRFLTQSADVLQIVRREIPGGRDWFTAEFIVFMKDFMALLVETIEQGIKQGLFRPVDPQRAARVFMTMLQGNFTMVYIAGERPLPPEQAADMLLDVFFQGIQAHR